LKASAVISGRKLDVLGFMVRAIYTIGTPAGTVPGVQFASGWVACYFFPVNPADNKNVRR